MCRNLPSLPAIALSVMIAGLIGAPPSPAQVKAPTGRTLYVRQTVGDDANDGLSAKTAWRHLSMLEREMRPGDTAYVGPGLYREEITVRNSGTAEGKITLIADSTGQHTGDPPGVVMLTGAEAVDGNVFVPHSAPGVYMAPFRSYVVHGVVEMDGDQYRYNRVTQTREYHVEKMAPVDIVAKFPSSWYHDEKSRVLYIHTSDGKPPGTHEMEIIRRLNGIAMSMRFYITIIGFTFRHMEDAGINFWEGSGYSVALNNTSYGNRQGIRVYYSQNIVVVGNTLFRNENAGVYFLKESQNGIVAGNTMYENIKGVRYGSSSAGGRVVDNTVFENHDAGIAIEGEANDAVVLRNRVVNNRKAQLLVLESEYRSDNNCFDNGGPDQFVADFFPRSNDRYKTLAQYQQGQRQDVSSRQGSCGALPKKVDVRKLHEETKAYPERARKILNASQ